MLGFVALNPTYILPVFLRDAKPNNSRFRNRVTIVSFIDQTGRFLARGRARVKLHQSEPQNIEYPPAMHSVLG